MDNEKWHNVLIEWVNCLKLCKSVQNVNELRNGEFFANLLKVITKNRDASGDILTFIFDLFGKHYPNYVIENRSEVHLSDLPEIDLKAMTSLLMHYTCIYDRRDVLTSPLCHSLSQSTQLIIRNFLQKLTREVTNEVMKSIIKSCVDDASDHLTNSWLTVETSSAHSSPLQDLLKTPISKMGRLQEKDKLITKLKTELDMERYEKIDLQEELKQQIEKNKKINLQLQQKVNEIARLRGEVLELQNRTPPHYQDKDSRDLQRRLRLEIQNLEEYVSQMQTEQDELRKENDTAKEQMRKLESQSSIWEEKFFETERNFESLAEHSKKQEEELKSLQEHCAELTAMLDEYRAKPSNDSSLFEQYTSGIGCADKALNETASPVDEDLACSVVEVQLRDAQKQNEELKAQVEQLERSRALLNEEMDKVREEMKKFCEEFEATKTDLEEEKAVLIAKLRRSEDDYDDLKKQNCLLESQKEILQQQSTQLEEIRNDLETELRETKMVSERIKSELRILQDEEGKIREQLKATMIELDEEKEEMEKFESLRIDLMKANEELNAHVLLLKREMEEKEDNYKAVERELKEIRAVSEQQSIRLQQEKEDLRMKLQQANEECQKLEQKNDDLLLKVDNFEKQLADALNEIELKEKRINELGEVQKALELQLSEVRASKEAVETRLACSEKKNEELVTRTEMLENKISDASKIITLNKKETEKLKTSNVELETRLSQSETVSEKLRSELECLRFEKEKIEEAINETKKRAVQLEKENDNLSKKLLQWKDKYDIIEMKNGDLLGEIGSLQKRLSDMVNDSELIKKESDEMKESKNALQMQLHEIQVTSEAVTIDLKRFESENKQITAKLDEAKGISQKLVEEKKALEIQNEELQADRQTLQQQLNNATSCLELKTRESEQLENTRQTLEVSLEQMKIELEALRVQLEGKTKDCNRLTSSTLYFVTKLLLLNLAKEKLQKQLSDAVRNYELLKMDFNQQVETKNAIEDQMQELRVVSEKFRIDFEELERKNEKITRQLGVQEGALKKLKEEKSVAENQKEQLGSENQILRKQMNDVAKCLKESRREMEQLKESQHDLEMCVGQMEVELETRRLELVGKVKECAVLEAEKETLLSKLQQSDGKIENLQKRLSEMARVLEDFYAVKIQLQQVQTALDASEVEKREVVYQFNELKETSKNVEEEKKALEEKNEELRFEARIIQKQLNDFSISLEMSTKELKELKDAQCVMETLAGQMKIELETCRLELDEKTMERFILEKEKVALLSKVQQSDAEVENLQKQLCNMEKQAEELKKVQSELQTFNKKLEQRLEEAQLEKQMAKDHLDVASEYAKKLETEKNDLLTRLSQSHEKCECLDRKNGELLDQIEFSQKQIKELETKLSEALSLSEKLTLELEINREENKDATIRLEEVVDTLNKVKGEKEALVEELRESNEKCKSLDQRLPQILSKLELTNDELEKDQDKMKSLEETVQDYTITISGLRRVIDNNLESLEALKEDKNKLVDEILNVRSKEKEIVAMIIKVLKENGIEFAEEDEEMGLKNFVFENVTKILDAKKAEEQLRSDLERKIEEMKAENVNRNNVFKQMVEKLQILVADRSDLDSFDTLKSNFDNIHQKINEALRVKEKLSEDVIQMEKDKAELIQELEALKCKNEQVLKVNNELEQCLREEKQKALNLLKELESVTKTKPLKLEKENILAVSTKGNKSKEEELKKENSVLKKKLVLTEHAKNNLEKVLKELREEKKKIKEESLSSSYSDVLYKKLLQEFIQVKEENEKTTKEKEEMLRQLEDLKGMITVVKSEDDKKLTQDLHNIREAYGNLMSLNSKLELEAVTLRKLIEERNNELGDLAHIKEAYEKLLEENNKLLTEMDTIKYKRQRDKEEFVRLLKKERDENVSKESKQIQDIRVEYEGKLERMKEKMLKLYREEVNKKVKSMKENENGALLKTIGTLRTELMEAEQKIQLLEMEKEILKANKKIENEVAKAMPLQTVSSVTTITTRSEERASTLPRPAIMEEITVSRRTSIGGIPNSIGQNLHMEDEEDLFNDKYLSDLKEGRCATATNRESTASRFSELAYRNSLCPPHLKSSYPAEMQFVSPTRFKDEDIKTGNVELDDSLCKLLPGEKPRKKDFGTTSYKKPGPPTPSKNGGRLSLQGNEVHPLRDHCEAKTPKKSTPSRIRALFTGRNSSTRENSEISNVTPTRGRRLNIFRRPR